MRDSAIIYRSFYESMDGLTKDQQADVWQAICEFSFNQKEVELTGVSKSIFTLIRPQLAANHKRYVNGKQPKTKQTISEPEAKQKQEGSKQEAKVEQTESKPEANKNKNVNSNSNKKENEKVNVDSSSSAKTSDGLTKKFLDEYNIFLGQLNGSQEQFSKAGRAGLSQTIKYFQALVEKKHPGAAPEFLDQETLKSWQWILNHYPKWDRFHQNQLKLEQINSNLVNIINHIKNGKPTTGTGKTPRDSHAVVTEGFAIIDAKYSGQGGSGGPTQEG